MTSTNEIKLANKRFRNWVFTHQGHDEEWAQALECQYLVFGREVAPTTGKKHLQGYIEFKEAKTRRAVNKLLHGSYVATRGGSREQAIAYCVKDDPTPFIKDKRSAPKAPGKRTDIDRMREIICDGGSVQDVLEISSNPHVIRTAEKLFSYLEQPRDLSRPPTILWYWGAPGTGKTKLAEAVTEDPYWCQPDCSWFDGYDAHADIILDDLRAKRFPFSFLLRFLDRYPNRLPFKGGFRQNRASLIIITCPNPPEVEYSRHMEDIGQLLRRITRIMHFKINAEPIEYHATQETDG